MVRAVDDNGQSTASAVYLTSPASWLATLR
jgi:hypothetical protein